MVAFEAGIVENGTILAENGLFSGVSVYWLDTRTVD
jgi:hypothetical protein